MAGLVSRCAVYVTGCANIVTASLNGSSSNHQKDCIISTMKSWHELCYTEMPLGERGVTNAGGYPGMIARHRTKDTIDIAF